MTRRPRCAGVWPPRFERRRLDEILTPQQDFPTRRRYRRSGPGGGVFSLMRSRMGPRRHPATTAEATATAPGVAAPLLFSEDHPTETAACPPDPQLPIS